MRDEFAKLTSASTQHLEETTAEDAEREKEERGGDNALAGDAALLRIAADDGGWNAGHGPRRGMASFYGTSPKGDRSGDGFAGQQMANGLPMDPTALIAAHKSLPFGSKVRVRRADGSREVTVTIMDRGPYAKGRILDLSPAAARELDMIESGHAAVELTLISRGNGRYHPARLTSKAT